jgi:hypothetical protein
MAVLDDGLTDLRQRVAALQRELDARTAERDEALAQQAATAKVLQVINASPGDLEPVFEAMLDKAIRLCEASYGILWTYDDERFRAAALLGVPPAYADFLREPQRAGPLTVLGRIARESASHRSATSLPRRSGGRPSPWCGGGLNSVGFAPFSASRCAGTRPCSAQSRSIARRFACFLRNRSHC